MAFNDNRLNLSTAQAGAAQIDAGLRAHMLKVYNYMCGGVALTGLVAYLAANIVPPEIVMNPIVMWGSMLVSFGMVLFLSARLQKIQASTAQSLFWFYAGLNGVWMTTIFFAYTEASIVKVFFITSASFAALSLYGYTTKKNLSGLGTFLHMGLFGLIIAMVVNTFLQSDMMSFVISFAGVLIFAGLTAYDTQKIKEMYYEGDDSETAGKKAIMGALSLYLDFINLFLYLLRFMGDRR